MATSYGVSNQPEVKTRNLPMGKKSFKEAFREARSAGDKTFMWQGKKYTTELAKTPSKTRVSTPPPAESARGMGRVATADNTRAGASKAMADTAALEAQQRRGASEARAKAARDEIPGMGSLEQQRSAGASARSEAMERAKENQRRRDMMMGREPEREPGFKKGGAVKGAGAAKRGMRPCKYI